MKRIELKRLIKQVLVEKSKRFIKEGRMDRHDQKDELVESLGKETVLDAITKYLSDRDFDKIYQSIKSDYDLDYEE